MEKKNLKLPEDWQFQTFEVLPGLFLSKKLVESHDFASLGVDAIVALDDWEYTWSPPVPENHLYVHFPIDDANTVDPKTRQVARLVADLVGGRHRVLVHCVQGLNRSGIVVARALMFLGYSAAEAIGLVRHRRGLDEGFGALGNERFVEWLMSEEAPGQETEEGRRPRRVVSAAPSSLDRVPDAVRLSRRRARRLAVTGQLLAAPRASSVVETVHRLGMVQMDPTSVVARTEHLVLWSRLGRRFRVLELERLLWRDRELFEYQAHILPTADLPMHRISMRRYPHGDLTRHAYVRAWLRANDAFVRYVLDELRRRGPLRARDLENRAVEGWQTGGWNDEGQNVPMLLDILWRQGRVMIVGRDGQQRVWDLAERSLPASNGRPGLEATQELAARQLRARGIDRLERIGMLFDGPPPGRKLAIDRLTRSGVIVPVEVDGLSGRWVTHRDLLDATFRGRTTLLSPFDDLISDRDRTERLFDMRFRLEIYVPKAKREFGYFVLPILRGDRLVGRIDPAFDRRASVLRVHAVHAQPDARIDDWPAARRSTEELASWLGAGEVVWPELPAVWR